MLPSLVPELPQEWEHFGSMLAADQRSDDPVIRDAAQKALDSLLEYVGAKMGLR